MSEKKRIKKWIVARLIRKGIGRGKNSIYNCGIFVYYTWSYSCCLFLSCPTRPRVGSSSSRFDRFFTGLPKQKQEINQHGNEDSHKKQTRTREENPILKLETQRNFINWQSDHTKKVPENHKQPIKNKNITSWHVTNQLTEAKNSQKPDLPQP